MKRHIGLVAVLGVAVALGVAWWSWPRRADPSDMLERTDLSDTSVSYSWRGGSRLTDCDVHVVLSGDGHASLQIGDRETVHARISSERYHQLLSCMAGNAFSEIQVKRRWGSYQSGIGRYEILLSDGSRNTLIYADGKHYIDDAESLEPILETIYSFEDEFGQRLDYGPVAMTCVRDWKEVKLGIIASLPVLCCSGVLGFMWMRKRKPKTAERSAHAGLGSQAER